MPSISGDFVVRASGRAYLVNGTRRYLRMMLQDLEGISRGAAVFNHWKVHNGDDTDLSNHDGIVRDGAGIGDVVGDDAKDDGNGKWPRANSTDTANSDGDS